MATEPNCPNCDFPIDVSGLVSERLNSFGFLRGGVLLACPRCSASLLLKSWPTNLLAAAVAFAVAALVVFLRPAYGSGIRLLGLVFLGSLAWMFLLYFFGPLAWRLAIDKKRATDGEENGRRDT